MEEIENTNEEILDNDEENNNTIEDNNAEANDDGDQYDPDKMLADAQRQYRERLSAIGGQFDSEGNFLGFELPQPSNNVNAGSVNLDDFSLGSDSDDMDKKLDKFREEILSAIKPNHTSGLVADAIRKHPEMTTYEPVVTKLLDAIPADQINDKLVLSLFYMTRGQAADVEIVKAKTAERKKLSEKIEAGNSAASNNAGGRMSKGKGKAPEVTDLVAEYAKAWGLEGNKIAEKISILQKEKK